MKKILGMILLIALGICIIMSSLLIGSSARENFQIIYIIISVLGIITIVVNKIYFNESNLIENKLDLFVLLLMLSSIIPLVFQTYTSLNDTVLYIYKYITIFIIYYIAKTLTKDNPRNIKFITNTTIIGVLIIVIFGIDDLTSQKFSWLTHKLNTVTSLNLEKRMISTFGYANSFAAIVSFTFILNLGEFLTSNKKYRYIYASMSFILLSAIFLSYSRTTLLILIAIIILYCIYIKEKQKRIELLELVAISGILSIIYSGIFERVLLNKNYLIIWMALIIMSIITAILQFLVNKTNQCIFKIKLKHLIILISAIGIALTIFIIVGLQLIKPLTIFTNQESTSEIKYRMLEIIPNSEYKLKFDINAKSRVENITVYIIKLIEENKYGDTVKEHTIELNNFQGIKELEIKTSSETTRFSLIFKTNQPYAQQGLVINYFYINGKEYPLNYQYLPANFANRMKDIINLNDICASERFVYSIDALKLIKANWLFGMGGNSWQYRYNEVQQYNYSAMQIHCYIIEIFFEFGIIGFISIIGIMLLMIYYGITNYRKIEVEKITVLMSIYFILIKSFIDFDMTFMHILVITFIYIGVFSNEMTRNRNYKILNNIVSVISILLCVITIYYNVKDTIIKNELNLVENDLEEYSNLLDNAIEQIPYSNIYKIKKYNIIRNKEDDSNNIDKSIELLKTIYYNEYYYVYNIKLAEEISKRNIENQIKEDSDLVYEILKKEIIKQNLSVSKNIYINISVYNIANSLLNNQTEISKKIYEQIVQNYDRNRQDILNHEKNRASYEEIEEAIKKLDEVYNNSIKKLEVINERENL